MPAKHWEIEGVGRVVLQKRRTAKQLRVSISADGTVRVTLPYWVSYRAGTAFVKEQKSWILEQQPKRMYLNSEHRIGKAHIIRFIATTKKRPSSRLVDNQIRIYYPDTLSAKDKAIQAVARRAAVRALTVEAKQLLPIRLYNLADKHGLPFASVSIKTLKSRWGSCSNQQEITLNCYLMQLPWSLIDYVLLHELTHTKVLRHGKPFWQFMQTLDADTLHKRRELRGHRPILIAADL